MAYPKKIVTLRPSGGIVSDLPANEVAPEFWTGGLNMQFRDGFAERVGGYAQVYDGVQSTLRGLQNIRAGTANYWLYYGVDSVYAATTSAHTDISPTLTGTTAANQWMINTLNGIPVACNGIDTPIYWGLDTGTPMAELPGWPAGSVPGGIRAHKYNLFAFNMQESGGTFPEKVMWSNSAEPGAVPTSWTALATNDAGDTSLAETAGAVIDAASLQSSMIFYKQHSCYAADYVGGNEVYSFRKLFATAGTLSKNCVVEHNGLHYVLADGDIFRTDGVQAVSLVDRRLRNFIFNQIDTTNMGAAFITKYQAKDEIWVCFPSSGNSFCDLAVVIDTNTGNSLGIRELPQVSCAITGIINDTEESQTWDTQVGTWASFTTKWNQQTFNESDDALIIGTPNDSTPTSSKMFRIDSGNTFDGDAINATINRDYIDFEDPSRVKFVRRVIPHIKAVEGAVVSFRIGTSMGSNTAISWGSTQAFTVGSTTHLNVLAQGKYISFEFSSNGTEPWTLSSFEVEAELRGYY